MINAGFVDDKAEVNAGEWKASEKLKKHAAQMSKKVLILDMAKIKGLEAGVLPQSALHFLQRNNAEVGQAGISLIILPDCEEVISKQFPRNALLVKHKYYQPIYEQFFANLEDKEGWRVAKKEYEQSLDQTVLEKGCSPFAFTKKFFDNDEAARSYTSSVFVKYPFTDTHRFSLEGWVPADRAQVYITPLVSGQGFHFASGEYYDIKVDNQMLTLPLTVQDLPIKSWHYRVDIHVSGPQGQEDIRYSLIALEPDKIDHLSVVHFSSRDSYGPGAPLLKQANKLPVCEGGFYCPLIVVHPSSSTPFRSYLPLHTVMLSVEEAEALPLGIFTGMQGEFWHESLAGEDFEAMNLFAKRVVGAGREDRSRWCSISVIPTATGYTTDATYLTEGVQMENLRF